MMRFNVWLAAGLCAGVVVGCSPSPSPQGAVDTKPSPAKTVVAANSEPKTQPPVQQPKTESAPKAKAALVKKSPAPPVKPASPAELATKTAPGGSAPDISWKPSKQSAKQIASAADSTLANLKGVQANIQYGLLLQSGRMTGNLTDEIQDSTHFSVMYPVILTDPKHGLSPRTAFTRANGKIVSEDLHQKTTTWPLGKKMKSPSAQTLTQTWPLIGNREVFAGLLDRRKPFSEYVDALLDPKNGYSTKVMERTIPVKWGAVHQYLISASRSAQRAPKLGDAAVQLILDADIHLPVTINVFVKKPGASRQDLLSWNAEWKNNQKFPPKDFLPIPESTKVTR